MADASKMKNLERALRQFEEFCQIAKPTKVEIAGIIQGFEFTLEVFWKVFKAIAEDKGYQIDSPRSALSAGFKMGFFKDEQVWVSMLKDRNETSHIYNEAVANGIYSRVKASYLQEFQQAFNILKALDKRT